MRFMVWSCGCTPTQIAALEGCGFDASFSSAPWWDFKAAWFAEEQTRLMRLAPPIAFPECPAGPRLAQHFVADGLESRRRLALRALQFAAAIGNGLLVPMGFEYGSSTLAVSEGRDDIDFDGLQAVSGIDLTAEIAEANNFVATCGKSLQNARLRMLSSPNAEVVMLHRVAPAIAPGEGGLLIVANADQSHAQPLSRSLWRQRAAGYWPKKILLTNQPDQISKAAVNESALDRDALELPAAAIRIYAAAMAPAVLTVANHDEPAAKAATRAPRIVMEALTPTVDDGRFAVKRLLGETVQVEATIMIDGHDLVAAALLWRSADQVQWQQIRMLPLGNDRWMARLPLMRLGRHLVAIEAWHDSFSSYREQLKKKVNAGLDVALELAEGQLLVSRAVDVAGKLSADHGDAGAVAALKSLANALAAPQPGQASIAQGMDAAARIQALLSPQTATLMERVDTRPYVVRSQAIPINAERRAVQYASWYELFPRSQSGDVDRHGSFADVIERLPAIRAMGFDTLYLPPIHPIGRTHRKGRNNALTSAPDDPGSPYAIGSNEGGHDAIHPQLGTMEDFQRLRHAAAGHGLELALDFAIQCAPDHPWLQQHPDWFDWRADGSIRYAENPPKKYEDIVNVNFYAEGAMPELWLALRDVVLFWAREGVRQFRVDNPHTKPLPFWEWLIADICGRYPDTIFVRIVHPADHDVSPGQGRIFAVVHLLHLASFQERIHRLSERADRQPAARLFPSAFFR
ncbi:maltotransferase domain-containing protein [Undibacterium arcticum]